MIAIGRLYCHACDLIQREGARTCPNCGSVAFYRSTDNPRPYETPDPLEPVAEAPLHACMKGSASLHGGQKFRQRYKAQQ